MLEQDCIGTCWLQEFQQHCPGNENIVRLFYNYAVCKGLSPNLVSKHDHV